MQYWKEKIKGLLLFGAYMANPRLSGASILMYHSISDKPALFAVSPKDFERQIKYIKERGFEVILLSTLITRMEEKQLRDGVVCITFDDGLQDVYTVAFPILKEANLCATVFLATSFIDGNFKNTEGIEFPVLSTAEIKMMSDSGLIEFMPHSDSHRDLSQLADSIALTDLNFSRSKVEALVGKPANIAAYPKGRSQLSLREALRASGWSAAVGVRPGVVNQKSDLYDLPRNYINRDTRFHHFRAKLSNAVTLLKK